MRNAATIGLSLLAATGCTVPEHADPGADDAPWQTGVQALVGGRSLDEDQWDPVEDHFVLGVELDTRPQQFPLGLEFGISGSVGREYDLTFLGQDFDLTASVGELYVGPRLTFDAGERGGFVPFAAAGVTYLAGELEAIQGSLAVSDRDSSVAGYAHAGFYYLFASKLRVGVDARSVFGSDLTLFGVEADADYGQIALVVGGEF